MKLARYTASSLIQYRRSHAPVALGVAVATAVLTGALLVGDSVRGSLRDLTLQRLGRIDQAVVTRQPFRAALADELAADPHFGALFDGVDAALLLRGSLSSGATRGDRRYAGGVQVVGVTTGFKQHGAAAWVDDLTPDSLAITEPLADELGVEVGDEVVLRLPTAGALPADSPLGEKVDTTAGRRLTIARVLPTTGLARFSLAPSQADPRNAFLPIATAQRLIDQPGKANALLIDSHAADAPSPADHDERLADLLRPSLEDYGLTVDELPSGAVQIESNQLVLPDPVIEAASRALPNGTLQPLVSYLANTIRVGDRSISYSTVSGVDSAVGGPLVDANGQPIRLADDEIVLNDWAAEQLGAEPGDTVTLTYYEPESTHGELVEASPLGLRLRAIVSLAGADGQPTPAADPRLVPVLEGVTDAASIDDWDLPFDLVEPITQADEDYWDDHSTTPKAFVSFTLAKRLWATRWGSVSLVRVAGDENDNTVEGVAARLRDAIAPAELGFAFLPVKRQGLAASSGTTPFDGLFFGFSLFLIASSVLLIALLFGLGVENRARELGLLSAVGWTPWRVRQTLASEGLLVALAGVSLGVPAGVAYAGLMIWGLTTLWVEAIVTPFLRLHTTPMSLALGAAIGLGVAAATIFVVVGRLLRTPARGLLAGQTSLAKNHAKPAHGWMRLATIALLIAAVGLSAVAATLSGEAQAGAFFGGGAALLTALLLMTRSSLAADRSRDAGRSPFGLWSLAWRNVARNASRSVLTIALVASASFLILAISAFRLDPSNAGAGGFVLVGQSGQPVHYDLNTDEGRLQLAFGSRDEQQLDRFSVHSLRLHDGEDASCLNLYQTRQPRVLGAPASFLKLDRFEFAAGSWSGLTTRAAPSPLPQPSSPIPVVLDFNTAMYSLKLYGGVGSRLTIRDEADRPVELEVVGLLKNSLLQGDLLMSEANFLRLFPSASGSRFFLIEPQEPREANEQATDELAAMLEDRLSDYGLDLERADLRLARFFAVQNTYLSTFQTLGGLGLLLGAVGVAVAQLRSLAERRGELALLRAGGFAPPRLRGLVLRENLLLLGGGLVIGAVAATLALAPQALSAATEARLPWSTTGALLAVILAVGLAVGGYATRLALRAPIIPALRGD